MTIALLVLLAALAARGQASASEGTLRVRPADPLARVSERLAHDPSIREVVLEAGTYPGGWSIPPLAGTEDAAAHPLLIRPADGARVVFDGAVPLPRPKPDREHPGVFRAPWNNPTTEPPKIWDPEARLRYLLAADLDAVAAFPGSQLPDGHEIALHPPDSARPPRGSILASGRDFGIEVRRPYVTVKGVAFRNFLARSKWSAAVTARADHVAIVSCEAANSPLGFHLMGDDDVLADSQARDVGCGAYVAGRRARVERNRFHKARDAYTIPMYLQDDTGIQAYYPAEAATIRGNLAVGFVYGILIKAPLSPWIVEENTLVAGGGAGRSPDGGFVATQWKEGSSFRRNIVAGYDTPATFAGSRTAAGVERNCYSIPGTAKLRAGDGDDASRTVTGDPGFVAAAKGDFRLGREGPCATLAEGKSIGAGLRIEGGGVDFSAAGLRAEVGSERRPARATREASAEPEAGEPRLWHVDPRGRDGAEGSSASPLRTAQAAIDRAHPGDTVVLHPGIYPGPVRIDHGGADGRPITLRAAAPWKAILDGARRHDEMIRVEQAAHVVIQGLQIRWYGKAGIHVIESPDVRVEGCRVWNAHWGGNWPEGIGVFVERSQRFAAAGNVLSNQERGFELRSSPGATITGNTAVGNLYAAVQFVRSIEGSTCTGNNFAYQGNDAIAIWEEEGAASRLRTLTLDYNNYGLTLIPAADEKGLPHLTPRDKDKALRIESKGIVYWEEGRASSRRFRTLEAWREFSSLDAHSIFADPLFVDAAAGDFRVEANSPNRGSGENGGDIGALTD